MRNCLSQICLLTPPRTPLERPYSNTCGQGVRVLDVVSLVSVRYRGIPYCQSITATMPSLYMQLDRLTLTLEFVQVFPVQLSIVETEDAVQSKKNHLVDIKDIPNTTELQLRCSDNSSELTIQLQGGQKGLVCFIFARFQCEVRWEKEDGG